MTTLTTKPPERTRYVGVVMANYDHKIDMDVARQLISNDAYATYAGLHFFCEAVWVDGEQFHAEVWRHRRHVDTISARSLEDLMTAVSDEYGWE